MTDASTATGSTVGKIARGAATTGVAAGAGTGLVVIILALSNKWGWGLTYDQALTLVPLISGFVHPFAAFGLAAMERATRWIGGEDNA